MRTIVLLTKLYPLSNKESYLNNEVDLITKSFDKVILIPVDAYKNTTSDNEIVNQSSCELFVINKQISKLSVRNLFLKNWRCLKILIYEIFTNREGYNHLRHFIFSFTYVKICYNQAFELNNKLNYKDHSEIIIYSYWLHKSAVTGALYKKYFNPQASLVSRAHSSDLYHKDWNKIIDLEKEAFMPFEKFKIDNCDKIYSISSHGLNHLKTTFPYCAQKFKLGKLGVLDPLTTNNLVDFNFFRIATCSGITPNKRMYRMPEILSHLSDLNIQWVHMGSANENNLKRLQLEIEKYKVQNMCVLKGWTDNPQVIEYYKNNQVNVFINLSKAEGVPVSIMEAFSFGIPAIATDTVGNPEIVDESCGFVLPIEFEAKEVSLIIRELFADKEEQIKLRKAAKNKFLMEYEATSNYLKFYREIAELN
jgi:glycosyltransferase involved in cell wall biosynthesis